jgi:phosphopantothenate-cysteine ligase
MILLCGTKKYLFVVFLQMVIANILHTRKRRVVLVMPAASSEIVLSPEEMEAGIEIESKIVSDLVERHELFIAEPS